MREEEEQFVEAMGLYMFNHGFPRMAGRIFAWLLICDPPSQTAADLADRLRASRGAISGAARLLTNAGLVKRTTRRGDRREYFTVPPGSIVRLVESGAAVYQALVDIADDGLQVLDQAAPERRARLQELRDVYAFFVASYPSLMQRFHEERDSREVAS